MALGDISESALQKLVARAQAGHTDAFEELYEHFFQPIYRYTAFRASSEHVEDLVADVFVKAWQHLPSYRVQKGIPFGAWLFRIARHTVIDSYRREKETVQVNEETPDPDEWNRADASVRQQELLSMVRNALDGLPKRYREILTLTYIAELPHDEVARVLRLTEGAVRILKFRALRKLEKLLPPEIKDRA